MTQQGLEPKPLDLLQLSHATRPLDDLKARAVFFVAVVFVFCAMINLTDRKLSGFE